jgi:Holliday junction DNA helicase RuvA
VIARISGNIVALEEAAIVVELGGLGLRVHLPASQLAVLGPVGSDVVLHTHLHVRETELELYGAADAASLGLFKELLKVSGIGPKLAMIVLSTIDADALRRAILSEDIARLTEVSGIGRKTAQRIILDLKSRLEDAADQPGLSLGAAGQPGQSSEESDALEALVSLGYTRPDVRRALATIDPGLPVEDRIVAALRLLAS